MDREITLDHHQLVALLSIGIQGFSQKQSPKEVEGRLKDMFKTIGRELSDGERDCLMFAVGMALTLSNKAEEIRSDLQLQPIDRN